MDRKLNLDIPGRVSELETLLKRVLPRNIIYKIVLGKGLEFDGYRDYTSSDDASMIDWKASLRARAGWLASDTLMLFITGGFAVTEVDISQTQTVTITPPGSAVGTLASDSNNHFGYVMVIGAFSSWLINFYKKSGYSKVWVYIKLFLNYLSINGFNFRKLTTKESGFKNLIAICKPST